MLTVRSTLRQVALAVGAALERHGIGAVLTGGACASLHSRGAYTSLDLDFVATGPVSRGRLDGAMADVGFKRSGDRYLHPAVSFWVEFPRGPLAVGGDHKITPVDVEGRGGRVSMLSATDSCRDRLAAFYHWDDRQSLEVAVQIARLQEVNMATIRRWSRSEGAGEKLDEFLRRVKRRR